MLTDFDLSKEAIPRNDPSIVKSNSPNTVSWHPIQHGPLSSKLTAYSYSRQPLIPKLALRIYELTVLLEPKVR